MGTTVLLYGESNAADVILSRLDEAPKSSNSNVKLDVRRMVLAEIAKQMKGFQPILDSALTESGTFSVYDANPILQNLRSTNPKLLDTFYKTTSTQIAESAAAQAKLVASSTSVAKASDTNLHKFILLGWVESIHEKETRTPIAGTSKIVLLYSLDIRCEYRLVNPDTNHVVAIFIGAGHGGIARILGAGSAPITYDTKLMVSDMFNSLAQDLRHILRVREDEYVKKKINAKKINVSMALPAK